MTTIPDNMRPVHGLGHVHLEDSMGSDLHIVNNARVSFDQDSDSFGDRERGLLNFLMRERHGSPWESVVFRFDVKCPLFVVREWQRHRMGCLTGDTEVSFVDTNGAAPQGLRKTMRELHEMWTEGERNGSSRVQRMRVRVLDESTNEFTVGHIADVIDSGTQQVFRVTTDDGQAIEMTAKHRILTPDGWQTLGDVAQINGTEASLPTDAKMMANGVAAHQNADWIAQRRAAGKPVSAIAADAGVKLVAHAVRIVSVTYVGVRQTYDLSIEGPWHNFVANGLVVHNSFNEQSARYSEIPDDFYVPSLEGGYVREQKGKPGAYFFDPIEDAEVAADTVRTIDETQQACFAAYNHMLVNGVAKELARTVLPVGMFTRMKWTVNLRALFNFLSLRNHEHAQREIRDYAVAVEDLARTVCPVAFEVFEANGRVTP